MNPEEDLTRSTGCQDEAKGRGPTAERRKLLKHTAQLRTLQTLMEEASTLELKKNRCEDENEELTFNRCFLKGLAEAVGTWTRQEYEVANEALKASQSEKGKGGQHTLHSQL